MSIPGSASPLLFASVAAEAAGFSIQRSLRFNSGDSAHLSRTPSSAGNRRTWTWSGWVKRSKLGAFQTVFGLRPGSTPWNQLIFRDSDVLQWDTNSSFGNFQTSQVFRDVSAWYHIVLAVDTTASTGSDRIKLYINGTQVTEFASSSTPSLNQEGAINTTVQHNIGAQGPPTYGDYFNGYVADVHFIDGQALAPTAFGEFDANNVWQAKAFVATGPNDGTTWSNSCSGTIYNASLGYANAFDGSLNTFSHAANGNTITFTPSSAIPVSSSVRIFCALGSITGSSGTADVTVNGTSYVATANTNRSNGYFDVTGISSITSITWERAADNDLVAVSAIQVDGVTLIDGNTSNIGVNGFHLPFSDNSINAALGYDAAVDAPTVNPDGGFDVVTYTGNSSTQSISSLAFQPDLVWIKNRDDTDEHMLFNVISGPLYRLCSSVTNTEESQSNTLTAFGSNGFTLGSDGQVNQSSQDYVAWCWKAAGTPSSNTDGSITSQVSASTDYGFSVVSFTGNGTGGATIGHSLGQAPKWIVIKSRNRADNWRVYHSGIGETKALFLSTSGAADTSSAYFNNTAPTNSVFSVGTDSGVNTSGDPLIAYCWSEVAGFSKFSSYSGNGSNTGTVVTTGFKPRFVLIKGTSSARDWWIYDSQRDPSNPNMARLSPNSSSAEATNVYAIDFLDNGFQLKTSDVALNGSGETYIYAAFADRPGNNWDVNNLVAEQPTTLPAVAFDGSGDYLSIPDSDDWHYGSSAFTVEGFAYFTSSASQQMLVGQWAGSGSQLGWAIMTSNNSSRYIRFLLSTTGSDAPVDLVSSTSFDLNKWNHFALTRSGNDFRLFIDGSQVASTTNTATLYNSSDVLTIGATSAGTQAFGGYISNLRIIKGTALYTSSFTPPTAPLTNVTYTKLLCCQSSSSTTAATVSPGTITANGNVYATELSDSTSANDSLIDTPTNYEATPNNGGNYATLNPLQKSSGSTLSNGNLDISMSSAQGTTFATMAFPASGKYYFECTSDATECDIGIAKADADLSQYLGKNSSGYGYYKDGNVYNNDSSAGSGASYGSGDIIGVAFDADAGTCKWYKNNVLQVTISSLSGEWFPAFGAGSAAGIFNFGQRSFRYTPPTGFLSLCTTNTPDPTIADGSTAMDAVIYSSTGSAQTISGLNISPDLVWIKNRSAAVAHRLYDIIRGVNKPLTPNDSSEEANETGLSAFNSDGFSVSGSRQEVVGTSGNSLVGWAWDAGSSTVSNTDGSITSNVRANPSAGFSIVTYSGNSTSGATVGHALSSKPELIIIKARNTGQGWATYHASVGANKYLQLDLTGAATSYSGFMNNTEPTNSVFSLGTDNFVNTGYNYVAYCFAPVSQFSAFGEYTGNGSSDGPFVYTGHRSRWVLIKDTGSGNWRIYDTARDSYNLSTAKLYPNSGDDENGVTGESSSTNTLDVLSNGFKLRTSNSETNFSGNTYIWASFAENPFKTARAR